MTQLLAQTTSPHGTRTEPHAQAEAAPAGLTGRVPSATMHGSVAEAATALGLRQMKECPQDLLDCIVRRVVDAVHPLRVYLFGSHATGEADHDSDIEEGMTDHEG